MALHKKLSLLTGVSIAIGVLAASGAAIAEETAPRAFASSAEVHKVVAEGAHTLVILATYQPGQRSKWHSHPEHGGYYLTSCDLRVHFPGGGTQEFHGIPEGYAYVQDAVASHQVENIGSKVCKILSFEPR